MDLKGILSISGHKGLFKLVSQAKNAIIVESFETGKRMPAYATSKIVALEDISIFTNDEDRPLEDVLKAISDLENGGECIPPKSSAAEIRSYFEKVLPEYDQERVYISDMKKVLSWYLELLKNDLLIFEEEKEETDTENPEEEIKEESSDKSSEETDS